MPSEFELKAPDIVIQLSVVKGIHQAPFYPVQ